MEAFELTLGRGDLVLCSGTLPRGIPFADRLDAAVAGGFAGVSLWGRDYWAARHEGLDDADIRAMLDGHGLVVGELDPAWWWLPGAAEVGASIPSKYDEHDVFAYGEDEMFRIAEVVGARSLNAIDVFGGEWDTDGAAEAYAGLCDRASAHGLCVHVEFLPWSRFPDVATAWEVVRTAGRPNGGIAVDSWHYFRGNPDDATLHSIPGDRVLGIQIDDGPRDAEPNLIEATLHDRLLPGEGAFDLAGLMDILESIEAAAPVGVEVLSDQLHHLGALEAARRAGDATRRLLATGPNGTGYGNGD